METSSEIKKMKRNLKMRMNKLLSLIFLCLCPLFFFYSCTTATHEKFEEPVIKGDEEPKVKEDEKPTVREDMVEATGIIKYVDLEGGFYGIIVDDKHYVPINLSKEFEMDGLKVKFKAKIRKDLVSIHMWGILIELTDIDKIK
jgi:hypothetical protein